MKKNRIKLLGFIFCLFFSLPAVARERVLNARIGVGSTFGPETVFVAGNVEAQLDEFFSFGPMLQMGLSSGNKYTIPTLGGRFTIPAAFTKNGKFPGIEFSLQTGMGALFRETNGFDFRQFAWEASINADVYVMKNLSVGLGGVVNVTDSNAQRTISALYVLAAFHY